MRTEFQQIGRFISSSQEIKQTEQYMSFITKGILNGFMTLLPVEVRSSRILQNPNRLKTLNRLLRYQMAYNDRLDSANMPHQMQHEAMDRERIAGQNLARALSQLDSDEQIGLSRIFTTTKQEVEAVERFYQGRQLSWEEVDQYRNLVNAISNCAVTSAVLGHHSLDSQISWHQSPTHIKDIVEKYSWMVTGSTNDPVSTAVSSMHHHAMAAQIDDDWYGRNIDAALGLETYASVALREQPDETTAYKFLMNKADEYVQNAIDLGMSKAAAYGSRTFWTIKQAQNRTVTELARKHGATFNRMGISSTVNSFLLPREQAYVRGELSVA